MQAPQEGTISWKTVARCAPVPCCYCDSDARPVIVRCKTDIFRVCSLQAAVTGKGRKRKAAPVAPAMQPPEPPAVAAKAADATACYSVLRPLLVRITRLIC